MTQHSSLRTQLGRIRREARARRTQWHLDRAIRAMIRAGRVDEAGISATRRWWANPTFAAEVSFVLESVELATSLGGPILECGTGLTTIALAVAARQVPMVVVALEHSPRWHQRITDTLERHRLRANVTIELCPIRQYSDFAWYDVSAVSLPDDIKLCVCDGPPDGTGDRRGLLPVVGSNLGSGARILLDDVARQSEQAAIRSWADEYGVVSEEQRDRWSLLVMPEHRS
jgi:hypothetical protein